MKNFLFYARAVIRHHYAYITHAKTTFRGVIPKIRRIFYITASHCVLGAALCATTANAATYNVGGTVPPNYASLSTLPTLNASNNDTVILYGDNDRSLTGFLYVTNVTGELKFMSAATGGKTTIENLASTRSFLLLDPNNNNDVAAVLMENITIKDFSYAGSGGAIWAKNGLTLTGSNTTFESNKAGQHGGAIFAHSGGVTIDGGITFIKNEATAWGGAIYASGEVKLGSDVIFGGTVPNGNKAELGGAIATDTNVTSTDGATGQQFIGNEATGTVGSGVLLGGLGGAIYAGQSVTLGDDATLTNNKAFDRGGAIWAGQSVSLGSGATISGNEATGETVTGVLLGGQGGAIYTFGTVSLGSNATISSNEATGAGGAIYASQGVTIANSTSTTTATTISGNISSANSGGAIFAGNGVNIGEYTNFTSNKAEGGHGGAIAAFGGDVTIGDYVTFGGTGTGNTATQLGGAIFANSGDVTIGSNTTFTENNAGGSGGAINAWGGKVISSADATGQKFIGNTSTNGLGGAIYAEDNVTIGKNAIFTGNTAKPDDPTSDNERGGAIFTHRGTIVAGEGLTLIGNTSAGAGGAFIAWGQNAYEDHLKNKAAYENGDEDFEFFWMYLRPDDGNITIGKNAIIQDNHSLHSSGGSLHAQFGDVIILGGTEEHPALTLGALNNPALTPYNPERLSWIPNTIFQNNTAGLGEYNISDYGSGGAIYGLDMFIGKNVLFGGGTKDNDGFYSGANHAQQRGGAIYSGMDVVIDSDTAFIGNIADYAGGAIFAQDRYAWVYINGEVLMDEDNNIVRSPHDHNLDDEDYNDMIYVQMKGYKKYSKNENDIPREQFRSYEVDPNYMYKEEDRVWFIGNRALGATLVSGTDWGDGGAINVHGGSFMIVYTTFQDNVAAGTAHDGNNIGHGGAIHYGYNALYGLYDPNMAKDYLYRPDIYEMEDPDDPDCITVQRFKKIDDKTYEEDDNGDYVHVYASTGMGWVGNGVEFLGNIAASHGGAIAAYGEGATFDVGRVDPMYILLSVEGKDVIFKNNHAGVAASGVTNTGLGGAIYAEGTGYVVIGGDMKTYNITFDGNSASQSGGAISVDANLFIGDGAVFTDNHAGIWTGDQATSVRGRGGAIHMRATDGEPNFLLMQAHTESIIFEDNTAVMYVSQVQYDADGNPMRDANGNVIVTNELQKIRNDIVTDGNVDVLMRIENGSEIFFQGGVIVAYDPDNPQDHDGRSANWTIWTTGLQDGGTVRLGGYLYDDDTGELIGRSRSYARGTTSLGSYMTLYLEHGAQFGVEPVGQSAATNGGRHIGHFIAQSDSTIAMEVDQDYLNDNPSRRVRNNQYTQPITEVQWATGYSWVHCNTLDIKANANFVLDGVIWQPNTIYNLVETTLLDASNNPIRLRDYAHLSPTAALAAVKEDAVKTIGVTTGLDRGLTSSVLSEAYQNGSFATNQIATNYAGVRVAGDMNGVYYWRDFVYYAGIGTLGLEDEDKDDARILTDANNRVVREFGNWNDPDMKGNIYAVELVRLGGEPAYYDPSIVNRSIAHRLMRQKEPTRTPCSAACGGDYGGCSAEEEEISCARGRHWWLRHRKRHDKWDIWAEGYGTGGHFKSYHGYAGNRYSSSGVMVGLEREKPRDYVLGAYYAYGEALSSLSYVAIGGGDPSFGRYNSDEHRFGAYLRKDHSLGYTLAMGYMGYSQYKSHRGQLGGLGWEYFDAQFDASTAGVYLEHGVDFLIGRRKRTTLTPFGGLQYAHLGTDHYTETSVAGWDMVQTARWQYDSIRTLFGARTHTRLNGRWYWNNRFHWEHELMDDVGIVKSGYLERNPNAKFRQTSNYAGRDWLVYGTGLELALSRKLTLNANYDIMFNRDMVLHTGSGGLTYRF